MDKKTAERMTTPCGLPCFHCPAHLATKNDEIRKLVAQSLNIPEEKASCNGCRPNKGIIPLLKSGEQCKIYQCTAEKNIDFCFECGDFPCKRLHPYADKAQRPHNTKMYQLCMIKKLGLEKWANEEAAKIWDTYRTTPFDFDNILY